MDDLFLYFDIIIRFFPNFQFEWKIIERSSQSLCFNNNSGMFKKIKSIAMYLPDFIIINLNKADNLIISVLMRGYGTVLPRSVYPFIPIKLIDTLAIILMAIFVIGIHYFV